MNIFQKKNLLTLFLITIVGCIHAQAPFVSDKAVDSSRKEILAQKHIRQIEKDLNGDPYKAELVVPYATEEEIILINAYVGTHLEKVPYHDLRSNPHYVTQIVNSALVDFIRVNAESHAAKVTTDIRTIRNAGKTESNNFMQALANNPRRKGFDLNGYFNKNFEQRVQANTRNGYYRY